MVPPGGARACGRCSYPSPVGTFSPPLAGKSAGKVRVGSTQGCALTGAHLCHRLPNWALFGRSASVGPCCGWSGRCLPLLSLVFWPFWSLPADLWPSAIGLWSLASHLRPSASTLPGAPVSGVRRVSLALALSGRSLRLGAWVLLQGIVLVPSVWPPRVLGTPDHPLVVVAQVESGARLPCLPCRR